MCIQIDVIFEIICEDGPKSQHHAPTANQCSPQNAWPPPQIVRDTKHTRPNTT